VVFALKPGRPGTEILDAETGRQKPPIKCANAHGDQDPGIEWPEIPVETPYPASYRKRPVCGDWMVVCAVKYEPVSTCNSLLSGKLTGNFRYYGAGGTRLRHNTGNFTIFGLLEAILVRKTPVPQPLLGKFPTQINRENILKNREFLSGNREFHLQGA
jgi:hypothetical protein